MKKGKGKKKNGIKINGKITWVFLENPRKEHNFLLPSVRSGCDCQLIFCWEREKLGIAKDFQTEIFHRKVLQQQLNICCKRFGFSWKANHWYLARGKTLVPKATISLCQKRATFSHARLLQTFLQMHSWENMFALGSFRSTRKRLIARMNLSKTFVWNCFEGTTSTCNNFCCFHILEPDFLVRSPCTSRLLIYPWAFFFFFHLWGGKSQKCCCRRHPPKLFSLAAKWENGMGRERKKLICGKGEKRELIHKFPTFPLSEDWMVELEKSFEVLFGPRYYFCADGYVILLPKNFFLFRNWGRLVFF